MQQQLQDQRRSLPLQALQEAQGVQGDQEEETPAMDSALEAMPQEEVKHQEEEEATFQEEALQVEPHRMGPQADQHLRWAPRGHNQSGPCTQTLHPGARRTGRSVSRSVRNCQIRPGMVTC